MLDALGNLGDFIGGLAVVVTLVYLAIQVRHNTAALATASRQEIVSGFREYSRAFLEPGAAAAYARGMQRYPDMSYDEKNLYEYLVNDHSLFFQGAFALHEAGTLEDETYRAYLDWFACNIATPGGMAWWRQIGRPFFTQRMVAAVDERLERGDLPDITQMIAYAVEEDWDRMRRVTEDSTPG